MEVEGEPEVKKVEVEQIVKEKEEKVTKVEEQPDTTPIEVLEVIDTPSPQQQPLEEKE